ncbi:hypothetical protein FF1_035207 [Malus domestica]
MIFLLLVGEGEPLTLLVGVKFLFKTTPHESYCEMCYCYVCDSPAPCGFWKPTRCHTSEHIGDWKSRRKLRNSK